MRILCIIYSLTRKPIERGGKMKEIEVGIICELRQSPMDKVQSVNMHVELI